MQQKVRQNIKCGADVTKVCATGGVLSKGDDPQASQYTLEEMKAIVADGVRLFVALIRARPGSLLVFSFCIQDAPLHRTCLDFAHRVA